MSSTALQRIARTGAGATTAHQRPSAGGARRCAAKPLIRDTRWVAAGSTDPSTTEPSTSSASTSAPEAKPVQKGVMLTPEELMGSDESLSAKKAADADRLRAAERFMVVGGGDGSCKSCGYEYKADRGDPDFPVARGIKFEDLPADYCCPVCSAPKPMFESSARVLAGFAENQKYGLGFNGVTGSQKLLVIYGALALGFILLIGGYAME